MPILKRVRTLLVIGLTIIGLLMLFVPKLKQKADLLEKHTNLKKNISNSEKEIESLRTREANLNNNPHYLEKLARNKLGYLSPDEVIYKVK